MKVQKIRTFWSVLEHVFFVLDSVNDWPFDLLIYLLINLIVFERVLTIVATNSMVTRKILLPVQAEHFGLPPF